MSTRDRLTDLWDLKDQLVRNLDALETLIRQLETEAAAEEKAVRRFALGEVWGAVKLGRHLGVSENTARKIMKTELADVVWTDSEGRMRVNAADVHRWLESCRAGRGAKLRRSVA